MSYSLTRIFGIDLGTTYSCIAYVDEHGKSIIIPNNENQRVTPSVVFFDGDKVVVGEVAKESAKLYPQEVVSFVKRAMGDAHYLFSYQGKNYRAEEISAYILKKLVNDAAQQLQTEIKEVVITCPAYFGINERESTRLAGEIAGLHVRQILNEPTAAAISYGSLETGEPQVVLVYDLGGGTFDITLIDIQPTHIQVICTGGDHQLGGKDWDDMLVRYFVEQFQSITGNTTDILADADTWQDLQLSAEKAKKTLSQRDKAPVIVTHGGERVKIELTREKFEELTEPLLARTVELTRAMLAEARKKGYNHFDEFLLVGGSVRMPMIMKRIEKEFYCTPKLFDPDEAVAKGAALYGWKLSLNDELIKRIAAEAGKSPQEIADTQLHEFDEKIVAKASKAVAEATGFTLAAVQRAKVTIQNVASKSFGVVAINQGHQEVIVNLALKNATVPLQTTRRFGTHQANQETVDIRIMENETTESQLALELGVEIGTAILELPPYLPAHSPIDITFKLNTEGRLEVTALEVTSQRVVSVTIETASVIQGDALAEAKERSRQLVVS